MSFRSMLKSNLKPFYCILYGKRRDTWRTTRIGCSAIAGSLCAFLICKCILKSLFIPKEYEDKILLIVTPIVASGFILTDAVKCITLLMFMSCFGKSGRNYLRALSFAFVISGPIANLSANTGEIVRTFSCSKVLAINLTRTRFDLMIKPFQKTLIHMKENVGDVQETFRLFGNVTKDLHKEILQDDDDRNGQISRAKKAFADNQELNAEHVRTRYQNKFRNRCLQQLNNGKIRCLKAFSNVFERCRNKMPFILRTLVCWPFKVNFLCKINILGNPEKVCDPSHVVPESFGESYVDLVAMENNLNEGSSNVKFNYTILGADKVPGSKTVEETARNITNEFRIKQRVFNSILRILQQVLGFVILKIVYEYSQILQHQNELNSLKAGSTSNRRIELLVTIIPLLDYIFCNYIILTHKRIVKNS